MEKKLIVISCFILIFFIQIGFTSSYTAGPAIIASLSDSSDSNDLNKCEFICVKDNIQWNNIVITLIIMLILLLIGTLILLLHSNN